MVYELLTLKRAFDGINQPAIFNTILKNEPDIPKKISSEIEIILKKYILIELPIYKF